MMSLAKASKSKHASENNYKSVLLKLEKFEIIEYQKRGSANNRQLFVLLRYLP